MNKLFKVENQFKRKHQFSSIVSVMDPYSAIDIKRRKIDSYFNRDALKERFKPVTSPIEISGTRYFIQFGMINEKWASVLLRDNRVIATHIYKDEDLSSSGFPNRRLIADWLMRLAAIPELNPQEIMSLIQTMTKQFEG